MLLNYSKLWKTVTEVSWYMRLVRARVKKEKICILISRRDIEIFTSSTIIEKRNSWILLKHVSSVSVKRALIQPMVFFFEVKNVRKILLRNGGWDRAVRSSINTLGFETAVGSVWMSDWATANQIQACRCCPQSVRATSGFLSQLCLERPLSIPFRFINRQSELSTFCSRRYWRRR